MVWAIPRSLATTRGVSIDFLSYGYLDVSVPRVCVLTTILQIARLPHSDIHGSIRICQSPWLIAAYRVLRRLQEPRHPPYALSNFLLTFCSFNDFIMSLKYTILTYNTFE